MGRRRTEASLDERSLTYDCVGSTLPAEPTWDPRPSGYRTFEWTSIVGPAVRWSALSAAVLDWHVKTRSGFTVRSADAGGRAGVRQGSTYWLVASIGPLRVHEPVRVVATVASPDRCGFAYGTLEGHPVAGEEAFVLHRTGDHVYLTLRSVTGPGSGSWRLAFPAVLLAQRWYRRRYVRALLDVEEIG